MLFEAELASKFSSSLSLRPNSCFTFVQENWQELSFFIFPCWMLSFGLVFHETDPVLWSCCSSVCYSAQSVNLFQPGFHFQNMIPLHELRAKASADVGFYKRLINSLPIATYSTVSSSWKNTLVHVRKVVCLLSTEYLSTILIDLQGLSL